MSTHVEQQGQPNSPTLALEDVADHILGEASRYACALHDYARKVISYGSTSDKQTRIHLESPGRDHAAD